jgi:hypothetical protein
VTGESTRAQKSSNSATLVRARPLFDLENLFISMVLLWKKVSLPSHGEMRYLPDNRKIGIRRTFDPEEHPIGKRK